MYEPKDDPSLALDLLEWLGIRDPRPLSVADKQEQITRRVPFSPRAPLTPEMEKRQIEQEWAAAGERETAQRKLQQQSIRYREQELKKAHPEVITDAMKAGTRANGTLDPATSEMLLGWSQIHQHRKEQERRISKGKAPLPEQI